MNRVLLVFFLLFFSAHVRADEQEKKQKMLQQLVNQLSGGPASYVAPATVQQVPTLSSDFTTAPPGPAITPVPEYSPPPVSGGFYPPPAAKGGFYAPPVPSAHPPIPASPGQELSDQQAHREIQAAFRDELRKIRLERQEEREQVDNFGKSIDGAISRVEKVERRVDAQNKQMLAVIQDQNRDREQMLALKAEVQQVKGQLVIANQRVDSANMQAQQALGQAQAARGQVAHLREKLKTPILSALFGDW